MGHANILYFYFVDLDSTKMEERPVLSTVPLLLCFNANVVVNYILWILSIKYIGFKKTSSCSVNPLNQWTAYNSWNINAKHQP